MHKLILFLVREQLQMQSLCDVLRLKYSDPTINIGLRRIGSL